MATPVKRMTVEVSFKEKLLSRIARKLKLSKNPKISMSFKDKTETTWHYIYDHERKEYL